jgi:hypothetical protein
VLAPPRPALQVPLTVPDQDLVDGVGCALARMLADELAAEALDPEPRAAAQVQGFLLLEHLAAWRAVRP